MERRRSPISAASRPGGFPASGKVKLFEEMGWETAGVVGMLCYTAAADATLWAAIVAAASG